MYATMLKIEYSDHNDTLWVWGCEMMSIWSPRIRYQDLWCILDPRNNRRDALILALIEKYRFSMEEMPYPVYLAIRRRAEEGGRCVGDYIARYYWEIPSEKPPVFRDVVTDKRIVGLLVRNGITPATLRSWNRSGSHRFKRNAILLNGFGPKRTQFLWDALERFRLFGPLDHVNPDPEEFRLLREAVGRFWSSSRRAVAEFHGRGH